MKKDDIEAKFKSIVSDIFRISPGRITPKTRFVEDLNAKSMDIIALIAATESTFGIKVRSQEANRNKTFGQSVAYIRAKMKKKK